MKIKQLFRLPKIIKCRKNTQSIISNKCVLNNLTILEGKNKIGHVNISNTSIGFGTYILSGYAVNGDIGRFTSIGNNFKVIDADHPIRNVSSYPGFYKSKNKDIFLVKNNIEINEQRLCENGKSFIIGSDVWIGDNVSVRGGVTISNGAVVGANAFVTKDVPPYAVVGGIPARIINFRFDDKTIDILNSLEWWNWPLDKIINESAFFDRIGTFIERNTNKKQLIL